MVCHSPPGTSKWNKIAHRLNCHITQNWRGRPLTSRLAIVALIAATPTKTGLTVPRERDAKAHAKGIKVSDAEMAKLTIKGDAFHPETHSIQNGITQSRVADPKGGWGLAVVRVANEAAVHALEAGDPVQAGIPLRNSPHAPRGLQRISLRRGLSRITIAG